MMREFIAAMIQYDRHLFGFAGVATTVRNKGSGRVMPEQFIQRIAGGFIGQADNGAHAVVQSLVTQLASGAQLVLRAGVKIDLGHDFCARLIRYCVSSGTGRPVAPFSLPDFHAVPAISRWAQR
jgi:hypothetical protein